MANNIAAVAKLCIKYITLNKSYPLKRLREETHECKLLVIMEIRRYEKYFLGMIAHPLHDMC